MQTAIDDGDIFKFRAKSRLGFVCEHGCELAAFGCEF